MGTASSSLWNRRSRTQAPSRRSLRTLGVDIAGIRAEKGRKSPAAAFGPSGSWSRVGCILWKQRPVHEQLGCQKPVHRRRLLLAPLCMTPLWPGFSELTFPRTFISTYHSPSDPEEARDACPAHRGPGCRPGSGRRGGFTSVGAPRGRWGDFGAQRGFPGKAPYRLRLRRSRGGVKV